MSSAFNFDLNEDIKLAAEVEKYPCLYNRFDVRYKKEPHCEKAWEDVGEALGLDKDLCLRKFINLKKRYSKKRNAVLKATNPAALERAESQLEDYSFLNWLDPHIRAKSISISSALTMVARNTDYTPAKKQPQPSHMPPSDYESEGEQPHTNEREDKQGTEHRRLLKALSPVVKTKKVITKNIDPEEGYFTSEHPNTAPTFVECEKQGDKVQKRSADEAFGNMVAAELMSFPQSIKCCIKHEINEIIYKYHKAENGRSMPFQAAS